MRFVIETLDPEGVKLWQASFLLATFTQNIIVFVLMI